MSEKLIMGNGAIGELPDIIEELGSKRILVITDRGIARTDIFLRLKKILDSAGIRYGTFTEVEPDPDMEIVQQCHRAATDGYDLLIGLGGGSSLDITKVVAVLLTNQKDIHSMIGIDNIPKPGIATLLIPTTAGTGSEVTPIAVLSDTKASLKKGIVSKHLYAKVALIDPELAVSLPPNITAYTGMDALAHAVEAYTNKHAQPFVDTFALESIRLIGANLRQAVKDGSNLAARYNLALASLYGGMCLGPVNTAAAHALAYPLGGSYDVPHGVATSLLLPHVMAFNLSSNVAKFARIAAALDESLNSLPLLQAAERSIDVVLQLSRDTGNITQMRRLNIPEEAIADMAAAAMKVTRLLNNNPREVTEKDARQIYQNAY